MGVQMLLQAVLGPVAAWAVVMRAEERPCASMDNSVLYQGALVSERLAAIGERAYKGLGLRVYPAMIDQAAAVVKTTRTSLMGASKRFCSCMGAQVGLQGRLVGKMFATVLLWTGKGSGLCMGPQMLCHIALEAESERTGFMRAWERFLAAVAAPVQLERMFVCKPLAAVLTCAAVGPGSGMAGHMARQMTGVGKPLAASFDRAGAGLVFPVGMQVSRQGALSRKWP